MGHRAQRALGIPSQSRWIDCTPPTIAIMHPAAVLHNHDEATSFILGLSKALSDPFFDVPNINIHVDVPVPAPPSSGPIVVDVETENLSPTAKLLLLGVGFMVPNEGFQAYIFTRGNAWQAISYIQAYKDRVGGHNFKYDLRVLHRHFGLEPFPHWDTMLMAHATHPRWIHGLKELAAYYCNAPDYEAAIKPYVWVEQLGFAGVPKSLLIDYLAYDLYYTYRLKTIFGDGPVNADGKNPYKTIYVPAAYELTHMENVGVPIDKAYAEECEVMATGLRKEAANRVTELSDCAITNPASSAQVARYLYDIKHYPVCNRKDSPPRTTNQTYLAELYAQTNDPVIDAVLECRRISKILTTYFETFVSKSIPSSDGWHRLYLNCNLAGTVTGRLSTSNPNIQQVPRARDDEEYGKMARDCIAAPPGRVLVAVDGSQWEIRTAAALSGDRFLIEAFERGADIHGETAAQLFGKDYTKAQRSMTKGAVFEFMYGGSLESSIHRMGLEPDVARAVATRFQATLRGLIRWRHQQFMTAVRTGMLFSPMGRRFPFPYIGDGNLEEIRKETANYPVQGLASDLTLLALCECGPILRRMDAPPVIFVHDSIVAECNEDQVGEVAQTIANAMVSVAKYWLPQVAWKVEAEYGRRWGTMTALPLSP